jgi:tetratricopeptide (TPR) repeat protein
MNDTQSRKREHVLPKWVSPKNAILKGETASPRKVPFTFNETTIQSIEKEKESFATFPSVEGAGYLLGASLLVNDHNLAAEMASFLKNRNDAGGIILDAAERIVSMGSSDLLDGKTTFDIARLRDWLKNFPKNAFAWIEIGRLYTVQGQIEKAKRAVTTAINLAPSNRYIVRCGVRFFLHVMDFDLAWHYIKRANHLIKDPWLKALELNVAMLAGKETPFLKPFLRKDMTVENSFHYSELLASYGNLEMRNGNANRAKKQFRAAWANPSEAVVAHAEWVTRNRLPGLRSERPVEYSKSLEALTWIQYYALDLAAAMATVRKWQMEETYSSSPFAVGSCIACSAGKPEDGAEMARFGLKANRGDRLLINNLCYSLLQAGKIDEAEEEFEAYEKVNDNSDYVFYLATKGLLEFKKGHYDEGRKYYSESMEKCRLINETELMIRAALNLAIAEVEAGTPNSVKVASSAVQFSRGYNNPDIIIKRQQLENVLIKGGYTF